MKARTIRHATAALAVLACLAGYAMTGSKMGAQAEDMHLPKACTAAWNLSYAYDSCGDRSTAPGSTAESVDVKGNVCVIITSCEYEEGLQLKRRNTDWQDSPSEISFLQNCNGYLKRTC